MPRSYAYHLGLSWPDFLKVNEIRGVGDDVRAMKSEVSNSINKLVANNKELQNQQIEATRQLSNTISFGFEQLSGEMKNISRGISELSSIFEWGFSELLAEIGYLNDSLQELIKIAKNPAQTWAYEQFEMACDAFRKRLFHESLEYLDHAINGFGDQTGYKLEYRFHHLLGTIHLGSYKNNSQEIIDLEKAENAFLNASKYAEHDYPKEASRSLLSASWAAYCQGKMKESKEYLFNALSLYNKLPETHFQIAKVCMHLNEQSEAMPYLKTAVIMDKGYIIKAYDDDDFDKKYLDILSTEIHLESKKTFEKILENIEGYKNELFNKDINRFKLADYIDNDKKKKIETDIEQIKSDLINSTYFGILELIQNSGKLKNKISECYRDSLQDIKKHLETLLQKAKDYNKSGDLNIPGGGVLGCIYMFITLGITSQIAKSFLGFIFVYILITYVLPLAIFLGPTIVRDYWLVPNDIKNIRNNSSMYKNTITEIDNLLNNNNITKTG